MIIQLKNTLKQEISNIVLKKYGIATEIEIANPKDKTHGDVACNVALKIAKQQGASPMQIANEILQDIEKNEVLSKLVQSSSVALPGFINFKISPSVLVPEISKIIELGAEYGNSNTKQGKTILIEHTSPNPTKEFHLGHLKTNVIGVTLANLFKTTTANVVQDLINNNRGIAVARLMWGYLEFAKKDESLPTDIEYWFENQTMWNTPMTLSVEPGKFVDNLYTKASEEFKKRPEVEEMVRSFVLDWEAGKREQIALWEITQGWVWESFANVLKRVGGFTFDKIWNEHEIYLEAKTHVERGVKMGIFKKLEDGAVLTNFEKIFKIPDTILIKRDGTSLYITQDLELSNLKRKTFDPDEMYWVIGPEQTLAMQQMFAASSQLGFGKFEEMHHIAYGFILVADKNGNPVKMSSRDGTQISVNDLIDSAAKEIDTYIKKEIVDANLRKSIAEKVAIGAIKYTLLKVSRTQDVIFDFKTSISLEGYSGPYVMYAYTRALSLLRKSEQEATPTNVELQFENEIEISIIKKLSLLEEVILAAIKEKAPNYLCEYLFELSQLFNQFYGDVNVLNESSKVLRESRLKLTKAVSIVLKKGLNLLAIEEVDLM